MHCQMRSQIHHLIQSHIDCNKRSPIHSFHLRSSNWKSIASRKAQLVITGKPRTTVTTEARFTLTSNPRFTATSLLQVKPDGQRGTSNHVRAVRQRISKLWERSQIHNFQLAPSEARSKSSWQCIPNPTSLLPAKPHTPHKVCFWWVQIDWY